MEDLIIKRGDLIANDKVETLIDHEGGLWVTKGVPTAPFMGIERAITIPDKPYVFTVDEMYITDPSHYKRKLKNVKVMLGHAIRIGGKWQFLNGQEVVETVEAYDRYAARNNHPELDFVIACNQDDIPNPLNIRLGEFDADKGIAYSVGRTVRVSAGFQSQIRDDGTIVMDIGCDEDFFGLDNLIVKKSIKFF